LKNILFICSQNKLRSPTAETVFLDNPNINVLSAGLNNNAVEVVSVDLVEWADVIFVMEKTHKNKLLKKFKKHIKDQRLICLNIPDNYEYMDPELVEIFKTRIPRFLENINKNVV